MSKSALFVVVPEAEPWVQSLRAKYDPTALVGVPAHVSVLFPFMPREDLNESVLGRVRSVVSAFRSFSFTLRRIARFPQTTYLAPEPPEPFASMTEALSREFPGFPPYGGRFEHVIPHLTVADQSEEFASIAERELLVQLGQRGAIRATCTAVDLFENSDGGYWKRHRSFALSGEV